MATATDIDLSWVSFSDSDEPCEGFNDNIGTCPNPAEWVLYMKGCKICTRSYLCSGCFQFLIAFKNDIRCVHGHDSVVTHYERINP